MMSRKWDVAQIWVMRDRRSGEFGTSNIGPRLGKKAMRCKIDFTKLEGSP